MQMHSDDMSQKLEDLERKIDDIQSKVRSLYRAQWWSRAWATFYLLLVLGVAGGIFYYTKPYVDLILNASQKVNSIPVDALNSQIQTLQQFFPRR
jgi:hypothetical protein